MEGHRNFNDVVAMPLTKETNEDWFEGVRNYLISKDLWEVTSSSSERPGENDLMEDVERWRRNSAAALHVIRISCGSHNLPLIRGASEAKVAWYILYCTYHSPPPPRPQGAEELEMGILYKAIYENNWSKAKAFIDAHPSALDRELAATTGETPLHVAVKLGHVDIVEELVRLVSPEYLETLDSSSNTPLLIAATYSGVIPIAECLLSKNSKPLEISVVGVQHLVPVTAAFVYGLNEMGRYLYYITPLHVFQPQNGPCGPTFLRACLFGGNLDIALDLLQRCKELLFAVDCQEISIIEHIPFLSFSLNKSQLPFWKRWIYPYIQIPSTRATKHLRLDIRQEGESNKGHRGPDLLHWLIPRIYNLLGMKEIRKMKQQHAQSAEILNFVCENLIVMNKEKKNMIEKALRYAAVTGNVEFLLRVTKANPELIWCTFPHPNRPFFFYAVASRKAEMFDLLRGYRFKHVIAKCIPNDFNTLLHEAARLGPPSYLNRISGAALQMQRELQWFKAVENVVGPGMTAITNMQGFNPLDFFKENHKELKKEGEEWVKGTSTSSSVVGALIVTIMFAAAFTVPGGNDQTSGYPIFLEKKLFKVFLIADTLSLFSSTTSVLTFLGILTSRYREEDFLYSLPTKLIIGLSTLLLSIATMMIAFSATIIIMLQHNSPRLWTLLPVILLAGVPITLFVLLQFPLLVEIISSTYGQSILKKKVVTWP